MHEAQDSACLVTRKQLPLQAGRFDGVNGLRFVPPVKSACCKKKSTLEGFHCSPTASFTLGAHLRTKSSVAER